MHDVLGGRVEAQRQRREGLAHEVDPEDVDGEQRNSEVADRGHEEQQHLAEVGGQQEENGLQDVVVDAASFGHRRHYGHEVVVREYHVGGVLGHLGARDAHGDSDVGLLERRGVVHTVAGHRHDVSPLLPCRHDFHLLLGSDARIDGVFVDVLLKLSVVELLELGSCDCEVALAVKSYLGSDRECGSLVVAGDHHGPDAGLVALGDGSDHLLPLRVYHSGDAREDQVSLHHVNFGRNFVDGPVCHRQHAQRGVGHLRIALLEVGDVGVGDLAHSVGHLDAGAD